MSSDDLDDIVDACANAKGVCNFEIDEFKYCPLTLQLIKTAKLDRCPYLLYTEDEGDLIIPLEPDEGFHQYNTLMFFKCGVERVENYEVMSQVSDLLRDKRRELFEEELRAEEDEEEDEEE